MSNWTTQIEKIKKALQAIKANAVQHDSSEPGQANFQATLKTLRGKGDELLCAPSRPRSTHFWATRRSKEVIGGTRSPASEPCGPERLMVVTVYPAASTGTAPTEVKRKVSRSPSLVLGATLPQQAAGAAHRQPRAVIEDCEGRVRGKLEAVKGLAEAGIARW